MAYQLITRTFQMACILEQWSEDHLEVLHTCFEPSDKYGFVSKSGNTMVSNFSFARVCSDKNVEGASGLPSNLLSSAARLWGICICADARCA